MSLRRSKTVAKPRRSSKRGLTTKKPKSYSIAISVPWKDGGVFTLKWLSHNLVDALVSQTHPLEISPLIRSMDLMVYAMLLDLTQAVNGSAPTLARLNPESLSTDPKTRLTQKSIGRSG